MTAISDPQAARLRSQNGLVCEHDDYYEVLSGEKALQEGEGIFNANSSASELRSGYRALILKVR